MLLLLPLLLGAAPAEVPLGKFQTWDPFKRAPLAFTSGGIIVRVAALPCPARPPHSDDSTCSWDGYNNQGEVTVTAPGTEPVRLLTDGASSYARIAAVRFDRRDPRPGVIVESQSGGSGGDMAAQLLVPDGSGYRTLALGSLRKMALQGRIADDPRDLSGDGRIDLQLEDARFDSAFGCNACTPRPPLFFAVRNGAVVDESRGSALRPAFVADMRRLERACISTTTGRNGNCAAFIADAARAGRLARAWAIMLRHHERGVNIWQRCDAPVAEWVDHHCPAGRGTHFANFPDSLRAFLIRTGYWPAGARP